VIFPARGQPPKMLQPAERPFDLPAVAVMLLIARQQFSLRLIAAFDERVNESQAPMLESPTQGLAVGRFVVDQTFRFIDECRRGYHQRLDQLDFVRRGTRNVRMQWYAFAVRQQDNLAAFAGLGRPDVVAPFFAGTNVASPRSVSRSSCFKSSLSSSSRCQARWNTPVLTHTVNRWWQTLLDGNERGKSCQRQPVTSTNRMPSRQSRFEWRGRPPRGLGSGSGKRSSIRNHWSSVSCSEGSVLNPVSWIRRGSVRDRVAMVRLLSEAQVTRISCHSCSLTKMFQDGF